MTNFNNILDMVMQLPANEKEMLIEIVYKRLIEEQREQIADYALNARDAYFKGHIISKPFDEIIAELNEPSDED